jgi:hypothetical protein
VTTLIRPADTRRSAITRELLLLGALASLVAGGLLAASSLVAWNNGGGIGYGFTASAVLELAAIPPEVVVLVTLLRLAVGSLSPGLYYSGMCLFVTVWLLQVVSLFGGLGMSEGVEAGLLLVTALGALAAFGFRIWFGVALIRSRDWLGGLAGALGAVELLRAGSWLAFRVLLVASDEPAALDQADTVRGLVGVVLSSLLVFVLFLGVRDRLVEGRQS